jgi:hypothetical protein
MLAVMDVDSDMVQIFNEFETGNVYASLQSLGVRRTIYLKIHSPEVPESRNTSFDWTN